MTIDELAAADVVEQYVLACWAVHAAEAHVFDNFAKRRPCHNADAAVHRAIRRRDALLEAMPV